MTVTETKGPTQMKGLVVTKPIAPRCPSSPRINSLPCWPLLWDEGHNDHLAGHITYKQPDGTFLVNPFGMTWGEIRASDIMRMDADGNELEGPWTITPAIYAPCRTAQGA